MILHRVIDSRIKILHVLLLSALSAQATATVGCDRVTFTLTFGSVFCHMRDVTELLCAVLGPSVSSVHAREEFVCNFVATRCTVNTANGSVCNLFVNRLMVTTYRLLCRTL